ncbi:hypothetical protein EXIGLDRAFT_838126, partial [Exidia glandulosa HHB12029]
MIARLAACSSSANALALASTSHALKKLGQEELYRVVVLTHFSTTIQFQQLVDKDNSYAQRVRALALPRYHNYFVKFYAAILKHCTNLDSLLIAGPLLGEIVHISPAELVVHGPLEHISRVFWGYKAFAHLQRLCFFPLRLDMDLISGIAELPALTHLGFTLKWDYSNAHRQSYYSYRSWRPAAEAL